MRQLRGIRRQNSRTLKSLPPDDLDHHAVGVGNGPRYVGRVIVTGSDPYGVDATATVSNVRTRGAQVEPTGPVALKASALKVELLAPIIQQAV